MFEEIQGAQQWTMFEEIQQWTMLEEIQGPQQWTTFEGGLMEIQGAQ